MSRSSNSLLNDSVTLQSILDFLASEKPTNITPVDVNLIVHLLSRKALDHEIFDSQQTLARVCACDVRTIARSQQRLQKMGWLSRPQRKGRTSALSLRYENIPSEKAVRTLVSQDSKTLSQRYMTALQSKGLRRKFPKSWLGRQLLSAQRILDRCGSSLELAEKIVSFAITSPRYRGKAKKSLYELNGQWTRVGLHTMRPQKPRNRHNLHIRYARPSIRVSVSDGTLKLIELSSYQMVRLSPMRKFTGLSDLPDLSGT